MRKLKNFVNGEFVSPANGKYIDKVSPTTGEEIYELPSSDELDVVNAIKAAHEAFEKWSTMKAEDRAKIMYKIADLIDKEIDDLALAETEDVGKPLHLAKSLDIPRAAKNFRFFASRILHKSEKAADRLTKFIVERFAIHIGRLF
jgi:aminomuconate-semialdehyde/2-hydroxymuconate-6-semialdehyde dehydrogenase